MTSTRRRMLLLSLCLNNFPRCNCLTTWSRTHVPCNHARTAAPARISIQVLSNMDDDEAPWWRRPPRVWPPRVDNPTLIIGDLIATYVSAYVCLALLTTGRESEWQSEGLLLSLSWLVGAAVTNAWDPTAVLPSLRLGNALKCVARASVDFASTRVALALVVAAAQKQAVDVDLLSLELALTSLTLALWRSLFMTSSADMR